MGALLKTVRALLRLVGVVAYARRVACFRMVGQEQWQKRSRSAGADPLLESLRTPLVGTTGGTKRPGGMPTSERQQISPAARGSTSVPRCAIGTGWSVSADTVGQFGPIRVVSWGRNTQTYGSETTTRGRDRNSRGRLWSFLMGSPFVMIRWQRGVMLTWRRALKGPVFKLQCAGG